MDIEEARCWRRGIQRMGRRGEGGNRFIHTWPHFLLAEDTYPLLELATSAAVDDDDDTGDKSNADAVSSRAGQLPLVTATPFVPSC
jgi:hypothetical protein